MDGEPAAPLIDLGAFDRVDASSTPEQYAAWMDHQRTSRPDRLVASLGLGADDRVLDIGCGTGVDLETMAGSARRVVGIDVSMTMARTARARCEADGVGVGVGVAVADGQHLPFRPASFDVCTSRAVLVHTPRPELTLTEILRVLRPGGRVLLSEPDQGSHVVATPVLDVFERLRQHRRTTFRNPLIGRSLADLAVRAGFTVTGCRAFPIVHRTLASARAAGGPFGAAVDAAVAAGAITPAEATEYLRSLEALDGRGGFFFAALSVTVTATRPGYGPRP